MKIFQIFFLAVMLMAAAPMKEIQQLVRDDKIAEAYELAKKTSEEGHSDGDEALGWFYENGHHVEKDLKKAARYFERAAKAGMPHSQWKYGVMLDRGEGVTSDPKAAFQWLQKSADQKYAKAFTSLGVLYATGRGTKIDYAKSMASYQKAVEFGDEHGFFGIGILHHLGQGTPKNAEEAASWMLVALSLEDSQAEKALNEILGNVDDKKMSAVIARARAISEQYDFELNVQIEEPVEQ